MSNKDKDIAEDWVLYYKTGDNKFFWATEYLLELTQSNPIRSWNIITLIMEVIESLANDSWKDFIISNLAAGPMEELLSNHGEIIIPFFDKECEKRKDFINLLKLLYKHNINDVIWDKIKLYIKG